MLVPLTLVAPIDKLAILLTLLTVIGTVRLAIVYAETLPVPAIGIPPPFTNATELLLIVE